MSHCAMRECSSNCQPVCGRPGANVPRLLGGNSSSASMNCTCAEPPLSKSITCLRNAASFAPEPFPFALLLAALFLLVFLLLARAPGFFFFKLISPRQLLAAASPAQDAASTSQI